MEEARLKEFAERFFSNLNCVVSYDGDVMCVDNVPDSFAKYYGKNAPYRIVFDRAEETADCEVLTKGSYLLKAMTSYLESSGETTLLKLNFDVNPEEELKKRITLENCDFEKLVKKREYDYFTRFTFLTTLQYLNGKEQVTKDVYVYKGEITGGDLSSYDVVPGNKRDVKIENIDEAYATAKDELKHLLGDKIGDISKELQERLEKEIYRIEKHFLNKTEEINDAITACTKKRVLLERNLGESPEDDSEIHDKISRIDREIDGFEKEANLDELRREKEVEIKDEMQRHSLNISNKLMNTTIIYYPLFSFDAFLKNPSSSRFVPISYNPLTEEMKKMYCDCCGELIDSLCLDGSGHLVCKDCLDRCPECGEVYCKKCLVKECEICNRHVCSRCAHKCVGCRKTICTSHSKKDPIVGTIHCTSCLVRCDRCDDHFDKNSMHVSPSKGSAICSKCLAEEIRKDTLKSVFE